MLELGGQKYFYTQFSYFPNGNDPKETKSNLKELKLWWPQELSGSQELYKEVKFRQISYPESWEFKNKSTAAKS